MIEYIIMNLHPQNTYNQYKVRVNSYNDNGSIFCLTVPRDLAEKFLGVKFTIEVTPNGIIYRSGLDLKEAKEEIDKYKL